MKGDKSEGWAEPNVENRRESWSTERKERISYYLVKHPLLPISGLIQGTKKMSPQLGFCDES